MPGESPAVILFDQDGYAVGVIQDDVGVYRLATDTRVDNDPFSEDRDRLVSVSFGKQGVEDTTYYVLVDLDGANYKHEAGSAVKVAAYSTEAFKSNSGAKWEVQLLVVLDIDGVSADFGIIPGGSVILRDTSLFIGGGNINTFPNIVDLEVIEGDFTKITAGLTDLGVTDINTGVTIEDALGNNVTPAVGDVLIRVTRVSGAGTLEFAYGMQYWVE